MSNHYGDMISLTTSAVRMTQDQTVGIRNLTLKAGTYNAGTAYFGRNATTVTGFLEGGESHTFYNIRPYDVWVWGTNGDFIMWNGDGS